jgi:transcriptional regulator with XRE-family HTH domain
MIRKKRKEKGLTQEKLALMVGSMSQTHLSLYELGKRKASDTTLKRIALQLDCDMGDLK